MTKIGHMISIHLFGPMFFYPLLILPSYRFLYSGTFDSLYNKLQFDRLVLVCGKSSENVLLSKQIDFFLFKGM